MAKANHPRRIAREAVLQALYAYEITKEKQSKVLKDIINRQSYDNDMKNDFILELKFVNVRKNLIKSNNRLFL